MRRHACRLVAVACLLFAPSLAACSSGAGDDTGPGFDGGAPAADSAATVDASTGRRDLAAAPPADLAMGTTVPDGTPTRQSCTGGFGSGLTTQHGRLDGYLVSIVPVGGSKTCNGDSHHIHLQVRMNGGIYDVAIDVIDNTGGDVYFTERDLPLLDGGWSEGWHPGDGFSYVTEGLHATDFTATPEAQLVSTFMSELQTVNHISIFGTGYAATGCHLIHFDGGNNDGAVVIHPLSSPAHYLMLHFANQSF